MRRGRALEVRLGDRAGLLEETFGRYRLLERLGQGGMAEVFKAKSFGVEGFEKVLVIKRILPELVASKRFVDMFVHEAKLAVRLSHANIVQVFDLGKVEDAAAPKYFIAMEYVAGLDLATLLARLRRTGVPLPVGMCAYLASEVAKGLDHAHRRRDEQLRPLGIVHRDVSPQNVLLSWEGEVKVTDFGIAKARSSLDDERADDTKGATLEGKYAYMSPEQASGRPVDARSDIFSLGTVLYEALAGMNPFSAPTTVETLRRVRAAERPPLEIARPDVPKGLSTLLDRALAPTPEERFPDAGRMHEELLAFLYASGARFGPNELSEFLARFRDPESGAVVELAADESDAGSHVRERTPVEVPAAGRSSSVVPPGELEVSALAARAIGLERREATALVLSLGARAGVVVPERLARAKEVLTRYGAHLLDDEPTQLVALFGLDDADGRDTETAVRCALVLLRGLASRETPPAAGVHAGRILLDDAGKPAADERLGALVATAQQMARLVDGRCGITPQAARNVRALFVLEPPAARRPGAEGGLLVGEVRAPSEAHGKFVGRKDELRRLGEVLALATRRKVQVVTVRGEQGIGKTRLLTEIDRRLRRGEFDVAFHLAACAPSGRAYALSGLTAMLQVLCGVQEGDPPERVEQVEPRLRALGLRDEETSAVLSQLGAERGGASAARLRSAFARIVSSLSADHLHVFAWDNAGALDDESIDVLDGAIQRMAGVRAAFLLAGRTGFSHPLERLSGHHEIALGPLGDEDADQLIAARAGTRHVPEELVEFCRHRAGGHPLFIEELVRELLDAGAVVVENGGVVHHRLDGEVAVPRPLRALLAERVQRLPPAEGAVLHAAAILGDPVDTALLAAMVGTSVSHIDKAVAHLEGRELVRRHGASSISFTSPLLREVALDTLTPEARRELSALAGAAYESTFAERAVEQPDRVARHFEEAGERDRAASYFARSGERRIAARQYEAATRELSRALDLCEPARHGASELAHWLERLANAVHHVRSSRELPDVVDRLLGRIDADGDRSLRVGARLDVARALGSMHAFDDADGHLAAARALADGDTSLMRRALTVEAELAMRRGDFRTSLARLDEAGRFGAATDPAEQIRIYMLLAQASAASGDRDRAFEAVDRAEALATPDDLAAACGRAKERALIHYFTRDYERGVGENERAIELGRTAGLAYEVAVNLHNLGEALLRQGDLPRAYAMLQQSCSMCDELGQERMGAQNRGYLAYLDALNGVPGAEKTLKEFIGYACVHGYSWDEVNGRHLLARLHEKRGDLEAARHELERTQELARGIGFQLVADDCDEALARLQ